MRFPLRWLSEWVELPHTDELVERLTAGGLEVETLERNGPDLSEIVVGAVLERAPHPDADRLSVCTVDIGEGETRQIVCGAPNVDAGQKVAVAVPGVRLQGKKLKKSKIRGVVSLGMICSERELELSDEHEGILVLDAAAPVGAPLSEVLDVGEGVLDIAITANRGDCTSMLGLAREVRAHFGHEIHIPEVAPPETGAAAADSVRVEIVDTAGCHAYAGRVVRGVRVAPSPEWVQHKLEAAGLRPINNVVDATNLVLLEFGQPLHAFDLDRVGGGVVKVRAAAAGEKITTLDGALRELDPADLVIADAERPLAVAGVMGGADSEVSAGSKNLLIESAHFLPPRVRLTARRLGLSTDASYRFERGVDRAGIVRALDRAARLIAELAGGEVATGVVEARGDAPVVVEEIELDPERVGRLLGLELSHTVIRQELHRVGIESTETAQGRLRCTIPSHRNDVALPADLIEEVARMIGYDQIPPAALAGELTGGSKPVALRVADAARDAFVAEGLVETVNLPFVEAAALDALGLALDDPRRATPTVLNPIVERQSQMRSSLVPSLLALTRENLHRQVERVAVFEVSRVFRSGEPGELPDERWSLCALVSAGDSGGLWQPREPVPPFFVAKGIAERALARLGHTPSLSAGSSEPYLHPGASAQLCIGKRQVGSVGELHPEVANRCEIPVPCALIEVDLSAVGALATAHRTYREVSRHPLVRRDLAVLLDRQQAAGEVLEAIRKKAGAHLVSAEVFDRYEGKGVPAGKVSLAFRLVFQRSDRTLTDAEVTKATDSVIQMLSKRFGGEQRSARPWLELHWGADGMTKAEIVEQIYERVGFSKKEAAELVEKVFAIMKDTLAEGEKVKVSGFGNFVVREKNARKGRNPQTGEEILLEARRVLTFKPSLVLKNILNEADANAPVSVVDDDED